MRTRIERYGSKRRARGFIGGLLLVVVEGNICERNPLRSKAVLRSSSIGGMRPSTAKARRKS